MSNNKHTLLNTLYKYVKDNQHETLEVKPSEYQDDVKTTKELASTNIEKIEKYKNSIIMNENKIICNNILAKFFELDDEKFLACVERIINWGFETCFKEFIINYYLRIKRGNRLRQYIILNLDTIISTLRKEIDLDLLQGMKNFNFEDYRSYEDLELLKNDLRNREMALMAIKAKNFNEYAPPTEKKKELLSNSQRKDLRCEIMNRLRYENPKLEEDF